MPWLRLALREAVRNQGRLTTLIDSGKLCSDLGLEALNPVRDRAMICGGPAMLKDLCLSLDRLGFTVSAGPATM